jgi:DNA topoisomerase-3
LEIGAARQVLAALKNGPRPTGRLHTDLFADLTMDRHSLELLLGSLVRAGLIELQDCVFEKEGRRIEYRKAALTAAGRQVGEEPLSLSMKAEIERALKRRKRKHVAKRKPAPRPAPAAAQKPKAASAPVPAQAKAANATVEQALRAWRLEEARRRSVPAFRILTDRAIEAIAAQRPETTRDLLAIPGIGLSVVEKYGAQIFALVHR